MLFRRDSKGSGPGMKKNKDQINAFLGRDTEFEGKLSFTGTVRIDGRFKGEILSEGTLIVGETAILESDIRVGHVIISGEVRGNIVAGERIEGHSPGKIYGNISAPVITIDEGVTFEGKCQMSGQGEETGSKVTLLNL
jgi:cytoskeletal protein CcmA (bactofilin family)